MGKEIKDPWCVFGDGHTWGFGKIILETKFLLSIDTDNENSPIFPHPLSTKNTFSVIRFKFIDEAINELSKKLKITYEQAKKIVKVKFSKDVIEDP